MSGRSPSKYRRIYRLAAVGSLFVGLALFLWGISVDSLAIPLTVLRVDAGSVLVAASVWGLISALLYFFPSPASVFCFLFSATGIIAFALGSHPPRRGDRDWTPFNPFAVQRVWTSATEWYEPYTRPDPLYGSIGIPLRKAHAHHRDFEVDYTIGPDGFRLMPPGPDKAPEIFVVGCSFTFGIGVEDHQTFVAQLAGRAWPGYKVHNWSFSGWGTNHACLAVEEALKRDPKPALVLYGFFFGHLQRNYLRQSWHQSTRTKFPLFDAEGNHQGLVAPSEATLPDSAELEEQEIQVTRAVIKRIQQKCAEAKVPFAVVFLQDDFRKSVREVLNIPGVPILDATSAYNESYPNDGHPTPLCHERLARAIATSPLPAELTGRPDLQRLDVFSAMITEEAGFRLVKWRDDDELHRRGAKLEATLNGFQVTDITSRQAASSSLQITKLLPPVREGDRVKIRFRAKAQKERKLALELRTNRLPWEMWARAYSVTLGPEEKTYRFDLPIERSESEPLCAFAFGDSDVPFSVSELRIDTFNERSYAGYQLECHPWGEGNGADLVQTPETEGSFRVEGIEVHNPLPWKIQLHREVMGVTRGGTYRVRGWIRADKNKSIFVTIQTKGSPGKSVSDFRRIDVTPEWQNFDFILTVHEDADAAVLSLHLGEDATPIEVHSVTLEEPS